MKLLEKVVYVVDDDQAVRKALTRSLTKHGYVVQVFENAEAFLDHYKPSAHSCLVLDVRMPGMSGMELQQELIRRKSNLPIIFITGHGDIPMSVRAVKDGAFEFLEKPYQVEQLLERVDQAITVQSEAMINEVLDERIRARYVRLTAREEEVMRLLVAGASTASNKSVARVLEISHRTVDDHRARVMAKMQARSLTELVAMAKVCGAYEA